MQKCMYMNCNHAFHYFSFGFKEKMRKRIKWHAYLHKYNVYMDLATQREGVSTQVLALCNSQYVFCHTFSLLVAWQAVINFKKGKKEGWWGNNCLKFILFIPYVTTLLTAYTVTFINEFSVAHVYMPERENLLRFFSIVCFKQSTNHQQIFLNHKINKYVTS